MLLFPDCLHSHRHEGLWQILLQGCKGVIVVITKVFLDCTPEVFNEVEFTMELGGEDAEVTGGFNDFLDK